MSVYTMEGSAGGEPTTSTGEVSSSTSGSATTVSFSTVSSSASGSGSASASGTESSFYGDLTSDDGEHRHMGCYVDARSGRMLRGDSTSSSKMTPARCNAFCSARGHGVFNLQYGTE